jgi:mannitol/fructose-specific phosphotransferase system IIA component (Ntr-type)
MKLSDIIVQEAIVPELQSNNRDEVIAELVESLAASGALPKKSVPEVTKKILEREEKATTGIGKGVALPHEKLKGVKRPIGTIGRSSAGIDFASLDGQPVYSVFLLLDNPDQPDEHLQAMETIFKHVQRDIFRKFLRQSETREAIVELIEEADEGA